MSSEEKILDTASMELQPDSLPALTQETAGEAGNKILNVKIQNPYGVDDSSNYPFQVLEISLAFLLNITGLTLALGWSGFCCLLPVFLTIILVMGNVLKSKREEYFMRLGSEANRHPVFKILCVLAIFSLLVGILVGMVVNSAI
jgi:hypothetical protein